MAIANPNIMNVMTATNDLILNLASPQRPCPLVHPFDNFVPNPTRMPAKANPNWEVEIVIYDSGPNGVNLFSVPYPNISKNIPPASNIPLIMVKFLGIYSEYQ